MWDYIQQGIRILLYMGAALLVKQGFVDESTVEQLVGAGMILATGVWTYFWSRDKVAS